MIETTTSFRLFGEINTKFGVVMLVIFDLSMLSLSYILEINLMLKMSLD